MQVCLRPKPRLDHLCIRACSCLDGLSAAPLCLWRVVGHRQELLCILSVSPILGAGLVQRVGRPHPEVLELQADPVDRGLSFLP